MEDNTRLTIQMLVRSQETFAQNKNDFSAGGAALQLYAELQATITDIEEKANAFGAGRTGAQQGAQTINDTREELLAGMFAIREASKEIGRASCRERVYHPV